MPFSLRLKSELKGINHSFTLQIRNLQLRRKFIYNLKRTGNMIHEILYVVCFQLFQNTFVEDYGKN